MSEAQNGTGIDLVRWTFQIEEGRREAIRAYLTEIGAEFSVDGEGQFVVTFDEPDAEVDLDEIVDELWETHGSPFEVTHEEFQRTTMYIYHHDETDETKAA